MVQLACIVYLVCVWRNCTSEGCSWPSFRIVIQFANAFALTLSVDTVKMMRSYSWNCINQFEKFSY